MRGNPSTQKILNKLNDTITEWKTAARPLFTKNESADLLCNTHLKENVQPISMTIFDCADNHNKDICHIQETGDRVIYNATQPDFEKEPVLNHAISQCSPANNWSTRYHNCTGIVAVGKNKTDGKEISFLTHQHPYVLLADTRSAKVFHKHIIYKIKTLIKGSEKGTVDVVIFGGSYSNPDEHVSSITALRNICKKSFGFEPVIGTGPAINTAYGTSAFFNTQKRQLFIVRPSQPANIPNQSYVYKDMIHHIKKWNILNLSNEFVPYHSK